MLLLWLMVCLSQGVDLLHAICNCPIGYYCKGVGCGPCPKNCASTGCDQQTGRCLSCQPGWFGTQCQVTCPPNCRGGICHMQSGVCTSGCVRGYAGHFCTMPCGHCAEPPPGKDMCTQYGDNSCTAGCQSRSFRDGACINQCGGDGCAECDEYGMCARCLDGWYGTSLSRTLCDQRCGACAPGTCELESGKCGACQPGYHGVYCRKQCAASCVPSSCVQLDGTCERCLSGWWGTKCGGRCPTECRALGCNKLDGACLPTCMAGYWGHDCLEQCAANCPECDRSSGRCLYRRRRRRHQRQSRQLEQKAARRNQQALKTDFENVQSNDGGNNTTEPAVDQLVLVDDFESFLSDWKDNNTKTETKPKRLAAKLADVPLPADIVRSVGDTGKGSKVTSPPLPAEMVHGVVREKAQPETTQLPLPVEIVRGGAGEMARHGLSREVENTPENHEYKLLSRHEHISRLDPEYQGELGRRTDAGRERPRGRQGELAGRRAEVLPKANAIKQARKVEHGGGGGSTAEEPGAVPTGRLTSRPEPNETYHGPVALAALALISVIMVSAYTYTWGRARETAVSEHVFEDGAAASSSHDPGGSATSSVPVVVQTPPPASPVSRGLARASAALRTTLAARPPPRPRSADMPHIMLNELHAF